MNFWFSGSRFRRSFPVFALLILSPFVGSAHAQDLPKPSGKVILTLTGNIVATNGNKSAMFDRPMLESLGVHTLRTTTNWTDGVKEFEGVWARDVLARVGSKGTTASAVALNDYKIDIPASDFTQYDVLLAFRMDGKDLLPEDKGPLWIVYPRDQKPELNNVQYDSRWVWQLRTLAIQ